MTTPSRSNRRAFLRGAGTLALGLPLLEVTHGEAWAQAAVPEKRFVIVFEHGGTLSNVMRGGWREDGSGSHHGWDDWAPADPGESLVLGPLHDMMGGLRADLLQLRGVDPMAATRRAPYGGAHSWASTWSMEGPAAW